MLGLYMNSAVIAIVGLISSPSPSARTKQALVTAVAELRRDATPTNQRIVLDAVEALEACCTDYAQQSQIDGRWTLIFSTQLAPPSSQKRRGNALQPLIDATYSTFFKFAPALAGAQPEGSSSASNEQLVDTVGGIVRNRVRIALPAIGPFEPRRLEIIVDGDAIRTIGNDLDVTFRECTLRFESESYGGLRVPLPRPVGSLRTTWCDDDMRISRGGRGGVFVLRRVPSRRRAEETAPRAASASAW